MPLSFTTDQVGKLQEWREILSNHDKKTWYESVKIASQNFNKILIDAEFENGKELTPTQIDGLFHQMKVLARNRALTNLLYKDNGLQTFNNRLRILLFGKEPLPKRIDQFVDMKGIREVTASHFLSMHNPKDYPFFSWQTYEALGLKDAQEQDALNQAFSENSNLDPGEFNEETIDYLKHSVVLREVKKVLQLESYPQVNVILWSKCAAKGKDGGGTSLPMVTQEKELYPSIQKWLNNEWGTPIQNLGDYYWVKVTANAVRKNKLGKWSRPDLVSVEVNRLDFLPQRNVQVKTFEIKRVDDTELSSVYEAAAHQRWAHYSYLIIEVSNKESKLPEDLIIETSRLGVGLMKAYPTLETPGYKLEKLIEPQRQNPEPKQLNELLRDFFKDDEVETKRFKDAIGR